MLLRLRIANHKSVRDEAEFSLVSSKLRTASPPGGKWGDFVNPIAGIYGANASGKSTVLDALYVLHSAVRSSATTWVDRDKFTYTPFAFDSEHTSKPSLYEIDFVRDGIRYTFGYTATKDGVGEEWLYSYPAGKRRVLYERQRLQISFGRSLAGENVRISRALRPKSLFLSVAAINNHPVLKKIHHYITYHFRFASTDAQNQKARLRDVVEILEKPERIGLIEALLRFADFGISRVDVHEEELPEQVRGAVKEIVATLRRLQPSNGENSDANLDEYLGQYAKGIRFAHHSDRGASSTLPIEAESKGTISWLSLAVPAIESIVRGEVLVVDELDSSLHPGLTSLLVTFFKDRELNRRGAQMLFSSHDVSLLGRTTGGILSAEEIWITEKGSDGATELFSIAEFPVRARDNLERRYSQGRYGGVPIIEYERLKEDLLSGYAA